MSNALEELKKYSVVVADTADFSLLKSFAPQDATTNPSLVLAGSKKSEYEYLILAVVNAAKEKFPGDLPRAVEFATTKLTVDFGCEILKLVPGRVSTEVDASFSFDTEAMVKKAHEIVALYAEAGYGKDRIYIKLASTWEGIQAARILEAEGINCNLTLLFSFAQALACAQAQVSLISPFVGRIMDFYKKETGKDYQELPAEEDPGVQSVTRIFNYYKAHGYKTIVMGASFRNIKEIIAITGCDKITIAPKLLSELEQIPASDVTLKLDAKNPKPYPGDELKYPELNQSDFLIQHNSDSMGVAKLAEGIRGFEKDTKTLEEYLKSLM